MARTKLLPVPEDDLQQLLVDLMGQCQVIGTDGTGRTVLQIPADDHTLARLLVFGTRAAALDSRRTKGRHPPDAPKQPATGCDDPEGIHGPRGLDEFSRVLVEA